MASPGRPKLNKTAASETIDALELGPEHEALCVMVRSLASAVDANPTDAALWREYRMAVSLLREAAEIDDGDGDDQQAFLAAVRTPVGDAKNA
jgi:hypothetical protein